MCTTCRICKCVYTYKFLPVMTAVHVILICLAISQYYIRHCRHKRMLFTGNTVMIILYYRCKVKQFACLFGVYNGYIKILECLFFAGSKQNEYCTGNSPSLCLKHKKSVHGPISGGSQNFRCLTKH